MLQAGITSALAFDLFNSFSLFKTKTKQDIYVTKKIVLPEEAFPAKDVFSNIPNMLLSTCCSHILPIFKHL